MQKDCEEHGVVAAATMWWWDYYNSDGNIFQEDVYIMSYVSHSCHTPLSTIRIYVHIISSKDMGSWEIAQLVRARGRCVTYNIIKGQFLSYHAYMCYWDVKPRKTSILLRCRKPSTTSSWRLIDLDPVNLETTDHTGRTLPQHASLPYTKNARFKPACVLTLKAAPFMRSRYITASALNRFINVMQPYAPNANCIERSRNIHAEC